MWTTKLYSQNLYTKVIVLFVFILYFYPSYTTADGIFSYKEENNYYGRSTVTDLKAYDDGTVAVRISRFYDDCDYDIFFLRIIYPDGTFIKKDIKLEGVQQFSYCNNLTFFAIDKLKYELIRMNQILVIYGDYCNETHVNVSGMIIDFDGNVLDLN
ncbi:hypothetical protein GLOIN_2v1842543 [Rhizophagus clarus]|uniref:Uncharacterized protein n=1 Tax=Rhizophagus clarus TaxID=94130 RepID=A0A8H3KXB3_9GLOM|nr:hypothetical protein GLOIN_2v1842543 [Rhizophagus clarus]